MIQPGEFCRVTNNGNKVLKIKYNNKLYDLDPARQVVIPVEAAILWFGDPRSIDKVQLIRNEYGKVTNMLPSRPDEIKRLRFKFGADLTGDESTFDNMQNLPNVEVMTLDGDVVKMVVDDPIGKYALSPTSNPAANQNAELLDIVKRQEQMIAQLLADRGGEATPDTDPLGYDQDTQLTNEDGLPVDDQEPRPFKLYNTETGIPGPSMEELVR